MEVVLSVNFYNASPLNTRHLSGLHIVNVCESDTLCGHTWELECMSVATVTYFLGIKTKVQNFTKKRCINFNITNTSMKI
jgi:hypothetical protein